MGFIFIAQSWGLDVERFTEYQANINAKGLSILCDTLPNAYYMIYVLDEDGWTPLMLAAQVGKADIVKQLIEKGADIQTKGMSIL